MKNEHVFVVADEFCTTASGGRVAQCVVRHLLESGAYVTVISPVVRDDAPDYADHCRLTIMRQPQCAIPALQHLVSFEPVNEFEKLLAEHRPSVVHFCSLGYHVSRLLLQTAKRYGARIVTQYFVHSAECARQMNCLTAGACNRCSGGNFYNAIRYGCGPWKTRAVQAVSRYLHWKLDVPLIDAALSTCSEMDKWLEGMGVKNIVRCPLPYAHPTSASEEVEEGDYFLFSGQFRPEKGSRVLERVIQEARDIKLVILPLVPAHRKTEYDGFVNRVRPFIGKNIVIDERVRWNTGGDKIARNCRAVLLPSVWPTSTEYTLLEALSMSKPIVAFNVGVHKDVLVHESNAMVYEIGDFNGYLEGIHRVQNDALLRNKLSEGARNLFQFMTDRRRVFDALKQAYGFEESSTCRKSA